MVCGNLTWNQPRREGGQLGYSRGKGEDGEGGQFLKKGGVCGDGGIVVAGKMLVEDQTAKGQVRLPNGVHRQQGVVQGSQGVSHHENDRQGQLLGPLTDPVRGVDRHAPSADTFYEKRARIGLCQLRDFFAEKSPWERFGFEDRGGVGGEGGGKVDRIDLGSGDRPARGVGQQDRIPTVPGRDRF